MTMATLGWGTWWLEVVLRHYAPGWAPSLEVTLGISWSFALVGFCIGLFTLRAKLAWILITGVPLFANGSLLLLPLVLTELRAVSAAHSERHTLGEVEHRQPGHGGE